LRGILAAALACLLFGAAPIPTQYSAPAGARAAGAPDPGRPYDVILPNGRIVAPTGKSVVVGINALGVALSPNGKYAIVSNDDEDDHPAVSSLEPNVRGGYTLAVVDTSTMRIADVYSGANESYFMGIAALKDPADPKRVLVLAAGGPDNAVLFLHLDAYGKLHKDSRAIAIPGPDQSRYANQNHAFPGGIALSRNRRIAYVVNNLANTVSAIDVRTRKLLRSAPVGYFPWAAAVAGRRLYVTDPGLMRYGNLPQPARAPQFANVPFAPTYASALTALPLDRGGNLLPENTASIRMDVAPDGIENVGGAQPSAIAISKNGRYAYVCMTNVDRIAIVDLLGMPRVVGGIQLRLFDKAPYGTQPDAIVRSPDGKRLYVALAGMDAIAVLDSSNARRLHRLGLIPTGWYPAALAISPNGRYLYVANAKGIGQEPRFQGDGKIVWATLQRIDMHKLPLQKTTLSALRYLRVPQRAVSDGVVPPLRSGERSNVIRHVVFILEENKTYDAMLGDLRDAQGQPYGDGDPSLVSWGQNVTPNLHALARDYGLATNFYADAEESDAGHQFAAGGIATAYTEKTLLVKSGRKPLVNQNEDPEDYPRAGYIFNALARAGLQYRDYGDLVRLSGYDEGESLDPRADDPDFRGMQDDSAPTSGLGGLYSLDVPALAALSGHIDLDYPGWNLRIRDVRRAKEFIRDYTQLEQQNALPDFTYIWLPDDHGGAGPDIPALPEEVADGDRALGMIVDFLSHQPSWSSTAIFITPDDAQSSRDHVNEHRTYAIVVSPYAKRHYTSALHLSTVSILKTEEELLGVQPLSLGDLLATDMSGFFQESPDLTPFTAIAVPAQTAGQSAPDADVERSARTIDLALRVVKGL
jgi:YVTN family beta-propeller protein